MTNSTRHARILEFPHTGSLVNARLDGVREETRGAQRELVLDYQELLLAAPPLLIERDGHPYETVRGEYVPRRLRFRRLSALQSSGLFADLSIFADLSRLPLTDPARLLEGFMAWRSPEGDVHCLLFGHAGSDSGLLFSARTAVAEDRSGLAERIEYTRDWSPPPPLPSGLVLKPVKIHQCYGGDPITIHLNGRAYHQRLFVGGLEYQSDQRPDVHAVLNLSEDENPWTRTTADRRASKGEGQQGMDLAETVEEAQWVIERLQAGQRVLVHCSAGLNRSPAICCAVLIQLEKLSAETALDRVREHHAWARPDSHYWLALRWLARLAARGT